MRMGGVARQCVLVPGTPALQLTWRGRLLPSHRDRTRVTATIHDQQLIVQGPEARFSRANQQRSRRCSCRTERCH